MYEKAAAINHKMYGANYNLGLIAFIQRDLEQAEDHFEKSLYGDLEAASYYQLAKIYIYKGEKDKAINFLNKAIELDSNLLKKAEKDKHFEKIREYITVSVKMDNRNEIIDSDDEIEDDEIEDDERNAVLEEQEKIARYYLEETANLIEEMSENYSKQKLDEKIDIIFNKEKRKKEKELEQQELEEKKKTKEERQKELGNN